MINEIIVEAWFFISKSVWLFYIQLRINLLDFILLLVIFRIKKKEISKFIRQSQLIGQ